MTWKELMDCVAGVRPRSGTVPVMKKPLRFRMKEGRSMRLPKKPWWWYAPLNKVRGEDKQCVKEEERILLQHDAP
jgi:hypothetical protein